MASTSTSELRVLEAGSSVEFTMRHGYRGRGIALGGKQVYDLAGGIVLEADGMTEVPHPDGAVRPVLVLNAPSLTLRTIVGGVFLGNLLTGLVVGIVALLTRM